MKRQRVSAAAARRIALAAQGFGSQRPDGSGNLGHLKRVIDRLGLLQIDSVNVLARAHYLPLFSRLGNYDSAQLDGLAWGRKSRRGLFEFWAHEASLLPLASQPLLRWRMARAAEGASKGSLQRFGREKAAYIEEVRREVEDRGAIAASELADGGPRRGPWWGWNDGKLALEWLFFAGVVTTATRRGTFERVYDLTERVLPAEIQALPTPSPEEAQRELLRIAARALGVATEFDLRDYFRLPVADTKARLAELVEAGDLLPVEVEGWNRPAYLDPTARQPRRVEARALLAPFDPLIWERDRTERIFDFFYRIEIYTPVAKRKHGYYVLPFLLDDRLVGRVDLKSDRARSKLVVPAAHLEQGIEAREVAAPMREELRLMADWLGLDGLELPTAGALGREWARMKK
ncbi:crosslink repair DNA glycosylase YcaQ family protein [uncultured Reyranella sp.]|uniref:winged helix-turn-helix domain-containing protein n=1 Tax=uncultured Reyranella sp. TaxID=735512 RepID=UPI00259D28E5|nr:crosslink repair DNA glycosylase YcaQ family protein [uncultured Reyranella sp.]